MTFRQTALGAVALLVAACSSSSSSGSGTNPVDGGADAATADSGSDAPRGDASGDAAPSDASDAVAPGDAAPEAAQDAAVSCSSNYNVPPTGLSGWSPLLSQSGKMTLTYDVNHSHDDGLGPLGFCPASVSKGSLYLKLVSARFETDEQPPDQPCVTDYTQSDPTFQQYGCCTSGGNHNIYVEVRDLSGQRIQAGFDVFYGSNVEHITDQGKPANEFPMNYAIFAGGQYGVRAVYKDPGQGLLPSDAVTNMRMPIHHHVNYLLTFQIAQK
jgi:hypothetical protein